MRNEHLSNLSTLMVSSQNCDTILVAEFQADEQRDGFNRVVAAIHVVSHEKVIRIRGLTSNSK